MSLLRSLAATCIIAALLGLSGCSSFQLTGSAHPSPTASAGYRAYGDSITFGATLSNPAAESYPVWVANFEKISYANNAIPADQACDVPKRQIFPNQDSPTLSNHPYYSLLIGTNDADFKGVGAYESIYELCHQASIAWLAVPLEYKVLATGPGASSTGQGAIDTSNHWNAWTTGGLGSTVTFTITTAAAGPIYAWPRIDDSNPATYSYSLDGVLMGQATVQTTPAIATQNGSRDSLGFLRLPGVAAGSHTLTFTQTSNGPNGVSVVAIGSPKGMLPGALPKVMVGTIPYQRQPPAGGGTCSTSDSICQEYIADIEADVNLFAEDGLNVVLFDTRKYMFGTPAEMNDALHPNAFGQMELSHSVEAAW